MDDAADLRFGDDFDDAAMLLNTEVAIILQQITEQRRLEGLGHGEHIRHIIEHASRFDLMKGDAARVSKVRETSKTHEYDQLHDYELVQMVNLGCGELDEAKTLIPSLRKKVEHGGADSLLDNKRLGSILDFIGQQRTLAEGTAGADADLGAAVGMDDE
ncbi:hypothetical protein KFE25_001350 [Diacronema lutheri]|uniref:RNA polymerase Rpb4/RPC9 core domain-containing protein n=1 Tax=Diacronema lutheri TaxID=2081491 RepID=A0A8J5XIG0_DIALT|nr:hypothetical protein KFE25_001350 [Diacronema lutheri]